MKVTGPPDPQAREQPPARERVHALFMEAVDMPPGARKAFLEEMCAGAAEVRAGVESLLAALERAGSFLTDPTIAPEALPPADPVPSFPGVGSQVGAYTLRRLIGEGGGGSVYLAEQSQPLRRQVALKVARAGSDPREVIARFEAERQALALMDHPHIAKVFDAGTTDDGRPYFVMELVSGRPVTDFCRAHRLALRARLRLFVSVCRAVEHAHRKGVVHRDLKPSNVLVAVHDRQPVAKVIDFGIAKALHGPLTDHTLRTQAWQFLGTPQYMSPEQVAMAPDVDPRSDVYSLGCLLYELATDAPPFDPAELHAQPFPELQRVLREVNPPAPSRRAARPEGPEGAGARREATVRPQELRGDIDWVVMRAMAKDRTRRYPSAEALAEDVQRHLDHRPVEAGPPGRLYRLRKLAARRRPALLACLAAACLLASGVLSAVTLRNRRAGGLDGSPIVSPPPRTPQPEPLIVTAPVAARLLPPAVAAARDELLREAVLHLTFDPGTLRRDGDRVVFLDAGPRHNDAVARTSLTAGPDLFARGPAGGAVRLGSDDRLTTLRDVGIGGAAPRSLTFFFRLDAAPRGRRNTIAGWGPGDRKRNRNYFAATWENHFELWASGAGKDWPVPGDAEQGVWHHHAVTYDGTTARWYVDGAEAGTGFAHAYDTADGPLQIGGTEMSVADLALFDRALTTDEVRLLAALLTRVTPGPPLVPGAPASGPAAGPRR